MSKPILGIDVDEPITQTGKLWGRYLSNHYKLKEQYRFQMPEVKPYNLSDLYITEEGSNGMEYFDYFKLYDDLVPREDALEFIPKLSELYDIVFISRIVGNHFCSKSKMLDKYFPYHKGFFGTTKSKAFVKCDIFVDDCYSNLNAMYEQYPDTQLFKFRCDYDEGIEPLKNFKIVYGWEQLYRNLV